MHNEFQISIISEYNKIIGDSSNILTELDKSVVSIANIRLTYFNNRSKNSLTSIGDGMNFTFEHVCSNS